MVYQWITYTMQGTKGSIDNVQRPGRGSMMCPNINEESDCLPKTAKGPIFLALPRIVCDRRRCEPSVAGAS
jgi:hypothetical protein